MKCFGFSFLKSSDSQYFCLLVGKRNPCKASKKTDIAHSGELVCGGGHGVGGVVLQDGQQMPNQQTRALLHIHQKNVDTWQHNIYICIYAYIYAK
jgi:hypothetical protein